MAPIRRYLRISPYSVLEVRIYLDNPADAYRWLLRPRDPVLPRVIEAARPYVLPKLREENDRAKKGGKRKGFKDIAYGEDFEISIFLTELSSPHSILTRHKHFSEKQNKLGGSKDAPVEVADDGTRILQEESDDDVKFNMGDNPLIDQASRHANPNEPIEVEDDVPDSERDDSRDKKKKMGLSTVYDGFQIYGRILCLVVKRKDGSKSKESSGGGKTMVEEWISSTQANENEPLE